MLNVEFLMLNDTADSEGQSPYLSMFNVEFLMLNHYHSVVNEGQSAYYSGLRDKDYGL
jgi:hypothetical protein